MASDTKDRIRDVAARLFEAQGFEGTAVSAILREAGCNSGSLYHFFPNKEGLLVEVLEHHLGQLDSLLSDAARAADDPVERVFALLELYRGRLVVSGFSRGCPVGDLALEVSGRHHTARTIVDGYFETWTARVEEWLIEAGDRFPSAVDRGSLARHVLSVMQGAVMQARAAGSIHPFDASVSQLRTLMDLVQGRTEVPAARPRIPFRRGPASAGSADRAQPMAPTEGDATERRQETGVSADGPAWWRAW